MIINKLLRSSFIISTIKNLASSIQYPLLSNQDKFDKTSKQVNYQNG